MKSSFQRALGALCLITAALLSACGGDNAGCAIDTDCLAGKVCKTGACVAPGQCAPGVLSCSDTSQCGAQKICSSGCCTPVTGCATSTDCTDASLPHCNATSHVCEKCASSTQCTSGRVCSPLGRCEAPCTVATASTDCKVAGKAKCTTGGYCGECNASTDCTDASKPICGSGVCFGCASNADCGGTTPVCNPSSKACVVCLDAQNSGGVNPACPTAGKNACLNQACVTCVASANDATGQNGACVATSVSTPACTAAATCVACLPSANDSTTGKNPLCTDAAKRVCDTNNTCIGCTSNAQCDAGTVCDTAAKTCHAPGLATFTSSATTLTLGATATLTATLDVATPAAVDIAVTLTSGGGTLASPQITIAAGASTGTVVYTAPGAADSVTVKASLGGVDKTVTLTISAAPVALDTLTPATLFVQAGATSTLTATLTAQATTSTTVGLASSAAGTATVPASVTIAAGSSSAAVTVTAVAANAAAATITASYSSVNKSAAVTVFNLALTSLTPSSASAAGGTTVPVTLAVTAPPAAATAHVTVDSGATINGAAAADVVVAAAATSTTFNVVLPSTAGTVTVSATANGGAAVTTPITVTAASSCSPQLVISQLFGGGGNSGSVLKSDFVELHNRGSSPVSLKGLSLQYTSAAGTSAWFADPLPDMTLAGGAYFTVGESKGTGGTTDTPADYTSPTSTALALSGTSGNVALVNGTTALPTGCPAAGAVIDVVGYGTAVCGEGAAAGAAPLLTSTTAVWRGGNTGNGCLDTNNNKTDFGTVAYTPAPRTAATAPVICTVCQ